VGTVPVRQIPVQLFERAWRAWLQVKGDEAVGMSANVHRQGMRMMSARRTTAQNSPIAVQLKLVSSAWAIGSPRMTSTTWC